MARQILANNKGGFTIHFSGESPAHKRTAGMHTHRGSRYLTDAEATEYRAFQQRYVDYYARHDAYVAAGRAANAPMSYFQERVPGENNRDITIALDAWVAALPESYDRSL
jgi:hypothetical protein